jgi:hypothetical protein
MMLSVAYIQTEKPQRVMKRLCKHWGHKLPVVLAEHESSIELPMGMCRMYCSDVLKVELQTDIAQMPKLQQVVADHLLRMANPEALVIEWQ